MPAAGKPRPGGGYFPTIARTREAAWTASVEGVEGQLHGAMAQSDLSWLRVPVSAQSHMRCP